MDAAIAAIHDTPYRISFQSMCGTYCMVIMLCIVIGIILGLQAIAKKDERNISFDGRYDTPPPVIDNQKELIREMNFIHDVELARPAAPYRAKRARSNCDVAHTPNIWGQSKNHVTVAWLLRFYWRHICFQDCALQPISSGLLRANHSVTTSSRSSAAPIHSATDASSTISPV